MTIFLYFALYYELELRGTIPKKKPSGAAVFEEWSPQDRDGAFETSSSPHTRITHILQPLLSFKTDKRTYVNMGHIKMEKNTT